MTDTKRIAELELAVATLTRGLAAALQALSVATIAPEVEDFHTEQMQVANTEIREARALMLVTEAR